MRCKPKQTPLLQQIPMDKKRLQGHLAILGANLIFGLNIPIAKSALGDNALSPFTITMIRVVIAAALFWLVSFFFPKERVKRRDYLLIFFASIFAVTLNQLPFFIGLEQTTPFNASILPISLPIITMLLAALFLREPITWKKALGVLLGMLGAGVLAFGGSSDESLSFSVGDLYLLLSIVAYALYLTLFKGLIGRYSAVTFMKWLFLFAIVTCAPFCLPKAMAGNYAAFDLSYYLRVGYVVFFATFVAYLLIPLAQQRIRPTVISMYSYVQPVVALTASLLLGMDSFSTTKLLAVVLVFLGVYFVTISKSRMHAEV